MSSFINATEVRIEADNIAWYAQTRPEDVNHLSVFIELSALRWQNLAAYRRRLMSEATPSIRATLHEFKGVTS